jgi:glycosyltransferase involved in cell wall biosynthesis
MRINVVTLGSGWILQKIAERVVAAPCTEAQFSLSRQPDPRAEANFYVDIYNCYRDPSGATDIGLYTHLHNNSFRYIEPGWRKLHFIVHMCKRYLDMFSVFYPVEQMRVLPPGQIPEGFSLKRLHIGVVQRGEHVGKGFDFMKELVRAPEVHGFQFSFVGSGWDEVVAGLQVRGVPAQSYGDADYSAYPALYQQFDYVLVPSLWEGGPMSVYEAFGSGVPVIAADVGWLGQEFPVEYLYPPGDLIALREILGALKAEQEARRARVSDLTYAKFATELVSIVKVIRA